MEASTIPQTAKPATLTLTKRKVEQLLALEKITLADIEGLTPSERQYLAETCTKTLKKLQGGDRDNFLNRIDCIIPASTRADIWEHNHSVITGAISRLMGGSGVMPSRSAIARETGLSRQTIAKHIKEYQRHPGHTAEMDQFKFMAPGLLASVYKQALGGDMGAAKLYLQMARYHR